VVGHCAPLISGSSVVGDKLFADDLRTRSLVSESVELKLHQLSTCAKREVLLLGEEGTGRESSATMIDLVSRRY